MGGTAKQTEKNINKNKNPETYFPMATKEVPLMKCGLELSI